LKKPQISRFERPNRNRRSEEAKPASAPRRPPRYLGGYGGAVEGKRKVLKRWRFNWPGVALLLLTPIFTLLVHHLAARKSAAVHQMFEELGSILVFAGRPLPNHAASKLVFIQYRTHGSRTNDSWGIYLQEIAGGKRILLDDLSTDTWREGVVYEQLRTLGWSPDDRYFAYCRDKHREIVICDANSGRPVAKFRVSEPITTGVWLSPQALVCSDGRQLLEITQAGGQWTGPSEFAAAPVPGQGEASTNPPITSLQAFSADTLLWQQGGAIWRCSRKPVAPVKIRPGSADELLEYYYSPEAQKFLLHLRDAQGDYLAELHLPTSAEGQALTNEERIGRPGYHPTQVQFINHGRGYAYLAESDFSLNTPVVKEEKQSAPVPLPWRGEIKSFAVSRQQLFVISSLTNEPTGIWQLDLVSGALAGIVSNQEHPFRYATSQPPLSNSFTNASGNRLSYYLLEPARVPAGRKAPLVFGVMGNKEKAYNWDRYAQAIANCGYYFVIVDRRNRAVEEWPDDVVAVYDTLTRRFAVDTNNVYLLGISVGAGSISKLLETRPELWRGAIYLSPSALPDPAKLRTPRILIDIGALDERWGKNNSEVKNFQDRAASAGVDVTLFIRPGVGHNCRLLSVEKERLHQLATFLGKS